MRMALVVALAVAIASVAGAAVAGAAVDPAEAWRPMHPFIGTWKGTRAGADGPAKVTRVYASATTNHHLEIREKGNGSGAAVWAVVSFDPQRQVLVLRHFAADGSAFDVTADPTAATTGTLVFESGEAEASRTRITYVSEGAKSFVERIERSAGGETFTVVSETRFVRAD